MSAPTAGRNLNTDQRAVRELSDAAFIARALIESCRLLTTLLLKRWPELR